MNAQQLESDARRDAILGRCPFDVLSMDRLPHVVPHSRSFFIINTDPSTKPGSHWVMACLGSNGLNMFFDSLGKKTSYYHAGLARFMGRDYAMAPYALQPENSQRCGQYVLFMCLYLARGYGLSHAFHRVFSTSKVHNDKLIADFYRDYCRYGFDYAYTSMARGVK